MKSIVLALIAMSGLSTFAQAQVSTPDAAPAVTAPVVSETAPAPATAIAVPAVATPTPAGPQCFNRDDGSSLCVNDRVIDYRNQEGVLQTIYADYTGVVSFDNGVKNTLDLQYVSREVQCVYGFCTGDAVSDTDGVEGRITDLYESGLAQVTYDNGEIWYLEVNELTAVASDPIPTTHSWPAPRAYPDVTVYGSFFYPAPSVLLYGWPVGYPYARPIYGRRVHGIFPGRPNNYGSHSFQPYPYRGSQGHWGREGVRSSNDNGFDRRNPSPTRGNDGPRRGGFFGGMFGGGNHGNNDSPRRNSGGGMFGGGGGGSRGDGGGNRGGGGFGGFGGGSRGGSSPAPRSNDSFGGSRGSGNGGGGGGGTRGGGGGGGGGGSRGGGGGTRGGGRG